MSLNEEVLEEFLALTLRELIIKLVANLDGLSKLLRRRCVGSVKESTLVEEIASNFYDARYTTTLEIE